MRRKWSAPQPTSSSSRSFVGCLESDFFLISPNAMKLAHLILKGFQQFRNLQLDFTDPATGLPVEKVCLIGRN
jgi:hypothetical protein